MKKTNVNGINLNMPFTQRTAFYLEGSSRNHQSSCFTLIDAAINQDGNELILLLENDKQGEEFMAIAFLPVNVGFATITLSKNKPIGAYDQDFAYFIKEHRWCEAFNSIDVELDDRCYENYIILTPKEINEV